MRLRTTVGFAVAAALLLALAETVRGQNCGPGRIIQPVDVLFLVNTGGGLTDADQAIRDYIIGAWPGVACLCAGNFFVFWRVVSKCCDVGESVRAVPFGPVSCVLTCA